MDKITCVFEFIVNTLGNAWAMRIGFSGFFVLLMAAHLTIDMVPQVVNIIMFLVAWLCVPPALIAWGRTPEFKAALQARLDGDTW